jgi:hypothetical protein
MFLYDSVYLLQLGAAYPHHEGVGDDQVLGATDDPYPSETDRCYILAPQ